MSDTPISRTLWMGFLATGAKYQLGEVERELGKTELITIYFQGLFFD